MRSNWARSHRTESRQGTFRGTPLQYAAAAGHLDVVCLLLTHDVNKDATDSIGRTPLMWAAMEGRTQVVQELLKAGADAGAATVTGWTAARYALDRGDREAAELLDANLPDGQHGRQ